MKDIFTCKVNPKVRPNNLIVKKAKYKQTWNKKSYNFRSANTEYPTRKH